MERWTARACVLGWVSVCVLERLGEREACVSCVSCVGAFRVFMLQLDGWMDGWVDGCCSNMRNTLLITTDRVNGWMNRLLSAVSIGSLTVH